MIHSLGAKFLLAFLAVTLLSMAYVGQMTLELWERDREELTRDAKERAEKLVRELRKQLEPEARGDEAEMESLAAEPWLDVLEVGRDYPQARAWLAARPQIKHLLLFDARGNLVWSDAPLGRIRQDPFVGDELRTVLTSVIPSHLVGPDPSVALSDNGETPHPLGKLQLFRRTVEGNRVRYEFPAPRTVGDAPNWMKDPSWEELGKTEQVVTEAPIADGGWYGSYGLDVSGLAIMRGGRTSGKRIGHLRLLRDPLAGLIEMHRVVERFQAEKGVEAAVHVQRRIDNASLDRYQAVLPARTTAFGLERRPAQRDLPWSRDPAHRDSVRLSSSEQVPWARLINRMDVADLINRRLWIPQAGAVSRETPQWLCTAVGVEYLGSFEGYLAVAMPMGAVLAPVEKRQREIARDFGLVLACAILTALGLARWVTRPIRELTAAAREVSATGHAPAVEPGRADEIGVLARAFNEMAAKVEARMLEANRVLAVQNDQLQKLNRVKSDFFAGLSHDLKTPLARIRGSAEVIAMESRTMGQDIAQVLDSITGNVDLVSCLVDKILAVSQLESEKPVLELKRVSLGTLAQRVADRHAPEIARRGLTLDVRADEANDRVHVDETRIEQVVANLLENSVKYSPPGTPVALAIAGAGEFVELRLSDRGPGLTADERERVFEKFYRADRPGLRQVPGIGLGLYMARMLTELHAGYLRAESAGADQGSTFILGLRREV